MSKKWQLGKRSSRKNTVRLCRVLNSLINENRNLKRRQNISYIKWFIGFYVIVFFGITWKQITTKFVLKIYFLKRENKSHFWNRKKKLKIGILKRCITVRLTCLIFRSQIIACNFFLILFSSNSLTKFKKM